MRTLPRRRRTRYTCRRYRIPLTALCLAAGFLLLHHAGFSSGLEQALAQLGLGIYQTFAPEDPLPDLPATDSPTLSLPGFSVDDLFSAIEPDDSDGGNVQLPVPPTSGSTGGNALPVTLTGGGSSYDPGRVYIKNLTNYTIDTGALLRAKNPVSSQSVLTRREKRTLPRKLSSFSNGSLINESTPSASPALNARKMLSFLWGFLREFGS